MNSTVSPMKLGEKRYPDETDPVWIVLGTGQTSERGVYPDNGKVLISTL